MPANIPSPVWELMTRAPRQNSDTMVAVTSTPMTIAMNEYAEATSSQGRMPEAISSKPAVREITLGTAKFLLRLSSELLRHESSGPKAVSNRSPRKIGIVTRLKKGGPTVTLVPVIHSEISGNNVPHRMVKHAASNSRLLNRKLDSRETTASSRFSLFRCSRFLTKKNTQTTNTSPRNAENRVPIDDCANACTEATAPLRVSSVPKMHSMNVMKISHTFHTFSMPRFSCIITECRNAVPVSHGMNEASSTGSQPQ